MPLETVCSSVAIFSPISYLIKCALLSEVPSGIYVLALPRSSGGVPYKKGNTHFFLSIAKKAVIENRLRYHFNAVDRKKLFG